jgi:hypothetical protein
VGAHAGCDGGGRDGVRLAWARGLDDRPWPGPRADWDMWNISEIAARHARGAGLGAVGAGKVLRQGLEDKQTMHGVD